MVDNFNPDSSIDNLIDYLQNSTGPNLKRLIPIGIARDGHLIYGPYNDDG
jgi:hypothetical protein